MKNKVLFVVGNFWPTKNGGTIRVEKLIKYLPEFEWYGVVFTRKHKKELSFEMIDGVSIYRSNSYNLPNLYVRLRNSFKFPKNKSTRQLVKNFGTNSNSRIADLFFVPDVDIFWAIGSIIKIRNVVKKESIKIIYSSSPVSSVHIAVLIYKKLFNGSISWITEFRDPWTLNPFRNKRFFLLEKLDNFLEGYVIKSSSFIVVTSEAYRDQFLKKYPRTLPNKIKYIPNGFDPEDFSRLKIPTKNIQDKINIVHTGNFYGKRTIKPFLQALNILYVDFKNLADKIVFHQYGVIDPAGASFNELYPNPIIKIHNTIPHKDSLQEIVNADWLLLVPGPGIGTMPGKIYEYLATGNPIIALVKEGPAKDIIKQFEIGYLNDPEDIEGIVNILIDIFAQKSKYKRAAFNPSVLKKFDRRNIAFEISEVLNSNLLNVILLYLIIYK
jgi:hypothetical protein